MFLSIYIYMYREIILILLLIVYKMSISDVYI